MWARQYRGVDMIEIYRIKSCLQDYAYTSKGDWEELEELKRLAEIGEATEKAFEDGKYITDASCKTLSNSDDLVEWACKYD